MHEGARAPARQISLRGGRYETGGTEEDASRGESGTMQKVDMVAHHVFVGKHGKNPRFAAREYFNHGGIDNELVESIWHVLFRTEAHHVFRFLRILGGQGEHARCNFMAGKYRTQKVFGDGLAVFEGDQFPHDFIFAPGGYLEMLLNEHSGGRGLHPHPGNANGVYLQDAYIVRLTSQENPPAKTAPALHWSGHPDPCARPRCRWHTPCPLGASPCP